jgi:pantoate--beta-alanine ligase
MGALHQGHGQLIQESKKENDITVVSIFVNPKQFAAHEDLSSYPRPLEEDIRFLQTQKVDILFLPSVQEIYPSEFSTQIIVQGNLTKTLEGTFRPHFFDGVTTIVGKLFYIIRPNSAYFGEKDFQQLSVIKKMTYDLALPIKIKNIPTVRDDNGLALSSRNQYLSTEQYKIACNLNIILKNLKQDILNKTPIIQACQNAQSHIIKAGFNKIDYLSIINPLNFTDLTEISDSKTNFRILVAAYIQNIRLIDNI